MPLMTVVMHPTGGVLTIEPITAAVTIVVAVMAAAARDDWPCSVLSGR
jgi:hypothetical protein